MQDTSERLPAGKYSTSGLTTSSDSSRSRAVTTKRGEKGEAVYTMEDNKKSNSWTQNNKKCENGPLDRVAKRKRWNQSHLKKCQKEYKALTEEEKN